MKLEKIILYHSSKTGIENIPDGSVINELGIHLASKATADKISDAKDGTTRKYEVDIKNPITIIDFARWEAFVVSRKLKQMGIINEPEYNKVNKQIGNDKEQELIKILKSKGYDGFVYENEFEGGGLSYVAFSKTQLKEILSDGGLVDSKQDILNAKEDDFVFVYHASPEKVDFIKPSDSSNYKYSQKGYVYVASNPENAKGYVRSLGKEPFLYRIKIKKRELLPDTGFIKVHGGKNTLNDSISLYGLATVKRMIYGNEIELIESDKFDKGGSVGNCFQVAGDLLLNEHFNNRIIDFVGTPYLVHAEITGQGKIAGIRYSHAWVEDDILVYDFSSNREVIAPKEYYYKIAQVKTDDTTKYRKYNYEEAVEKMLDTGHYGSWDLDTEFADGGRLDIFNNEKSFNVNIDEIIKELKAKTEVKSKEIIAGKEKIKALNIEKPKKAEDKMQREIKIKAIGDQEKSGYRNKIIEWAKDIDNKVKIIIAFSGGKDSIAMVLHLLELDFPKEQIELWHHDIDGHGEELWDWHCTPSYCKAFAKALELKILFSYAKGGITREIYRNFETIQPILFQDEMDGQFIELLPEPMRTIKNGIVQTEEQLREANTRYKFPAVSKDLNVRWCSWIAKLGVMTKAINNSKRLQNSNILVLTGERRLESAARSLYLEIEPHRSNSNTRRVVLWRPVVDWTEQQVWDIMKKHKVQPHPCYELGWGRCSCQLCIFGRENIWASINQISHEKVKRISEIEKEIGHKLYNVENKIETGEIETKGKNKGKPVMISTGDKLGIYESMVNKGNSFIKEENRLRWEKEALGEFRSPIFVDEWKLPAGAFNADDCGAN